MASELHAEADNREDCETGTEPWMQEGTERHCGNRAHLEDERMQREREREQEGVVSENSADSG